MARFVDREMRMTALTAAAISNSGRAWAPARDVLNDAAQFEEWLRRDTPEPEFHRKIEVK